MEYEYDTTNNDEFQQLLHEKFPEIPHEEVTTKKKNVWKKAMNLVLYGFAFSLINLEYLQLNMVFPTLGNVLMLLGFRQLKKENKFFKACYVISVLRMISAVFDLITETMIDVNEWIYPITFAIVFVFAVLSIIQIVLLRIALKAAWEKTGGYTDVQAATALVALYVLMSPVSFIVGYFDFRLMAVVMILFIIAIIWALFGIGKIVDKLEEARYYVEPLPVSRCEKIGAVSLVLVLVAGLASGYAFFGEYKMNWSENTQSQSAEIQKIKNHLVKLGFPKDILNDLTEEEIRSFDGAKKVICQKYTNDFSYGGRDNERFNAEMTDEKDQLPVTGIAVELSGKREAWTIIHYFQWSPNTSFHGTEAISLSPDYCSNKEALVKSEPSGHVLYDKDGTTYMSDYRSNETYILEDDDVLLQMFETQTETEENCFTFSFPKNGENCRGYIMYSQYSKLDGYILRSIMDYVHQCSRFQYPVVTAEEIVIEDEYTDTLQFRTRRYGMVMSF